MIRLAVRVPAAHAELALAELLELAPDGVEETELPDLDGGPAVEYAIYGAPGELPDLPALRAVLAGVEVDVSTSEIPDDWTERWKRFHRPVLIDAPRSPRRRGKAGSGPFGGGRPDGETPSLHVRPPWADPRPESDVREIVIDPAQAFGTGAHPTTRLCLELLLEVAGAEPHRGPVLDVGAGSGVLAIAAASLGYGPVLALDNDREAIAAIEANAALNEVEVEARRFDLRREPLPATVLLATALPATVPPATVLPAAVLPATVPPAGGLGIVLANLLRPLLLDLAASMTVPPPHLIASGLLREEAYEVAAAFAERLSLRERERRERGEWAALWLTPR